MNMKSRLQRIGKFIGAGLPFREGVNLTNKLAIHGFFRPGHDHRSAPRGLQKAAILMAMACGISMLRKPRSPEKAEKARRALGLAGGEDDQAVLERCRAIGREAQFNQAEQEELETVIGGMLKRKQTFQAST